MTEAMIFAFLMVFLRAGAMLMSSPIFGAQNTPITVRILTTLSISAALTCVVQPKLGPAPTGMFDLIAAGMKELFAGLLIGTFMSLALQVAQLAGALMDMNVGLTQSQIMNPVSGISVTILAQYKFMLGVVIFLSTNAHQIVIKAFVKSYEAMPGGLTAASLPALQHSYTQMLTAVFILSIQIAAPVMAVGILVDGAFGLISRAVPQMQVMQVGLPAKLGIGLLAVSLGLPALAVGITSAVNQGMIALDPLFRR